MADSHTLLFLHLPHKHLIHNLSSPLPILLIVSLNSDNPSSIDMSKGIELVVWSPVITKDCFPISKKGTVKRPRVIDARPPGVFDRAALQAIKKWKYKPKIMNGVPVETVGVQVKLTFKLDEM